MTGKPQRASDGTRRARPAGSSARSQKLNTTWATAWSFDAFASPVALSVSSRTSSARRGPEYPIGADAVNVAPGASVPVETGAIPYGEGAVGTARRRAACPRS